MDVSFNCKPMKPFGIKKKLTDKTTNGEKVPSL